MCTAVATYRLRSAPSGDYVTYTIICGTSRRSKRDRSLSRCGVAQGAWSMDIDAIAIRGLDRETVRRLSQRSDARGFLQLAVHVSLLSASGFLVWASRGHLWLAPA